MPSGDGKFEYRDGVAVVQVVVFSAFLLFGLNFKRTHRNGWFCIGVFALLRVVGGSCMLALIHNRSDALWAAVLVAEAIGIILMMFLLLELLERVNHSIQVIPKRMFWIPQLITWADIGVSIAGWVAISKNEDALAPTVYSQVGMILIAVIYLIVLGIFAFLWLRRAQVPIEERLSLTCVLVCMPLLAIRIVYSLVYVVTGDKTWNAIVGNPTIYIFLTMIPEIGIVGSCIWTILQLKLPTRESVEEERGEDQARREEQDGDEESRQNLVLMASRNSSN